MPTTMRSPAAHTGAIDFSSRYSRICASTRSAVCRNAISRSAIRLPFWKKFASARSTCLRHVDLARAQPRQQFVGRQVDQLDFVGGLEERVGQRFVDANAGDLADDIVEAFDVLDVERRVDVDAGGEQFVDVLPALRVTRAGRVGVRQFVDQNERRPARERRVEVEFLDRRALDVEHQRRQLLQAVEQRRGLGTAVRFQQPDDDVGAGARLLVRRGQHRVGLADAGGGAEEDLQPAAALARGRRVDLCQQRVRVGSFRFHAQPSSCDDG